MAVGGLEEYQGIVVPYQNDKTVLTSMISNSFQHIEKKSVLEAS